MHGARKLVLAVLGKSHHCCRWRHVLQACTGFLTCQRTSGPRGSTVSGCRDPGSGAPTSCGLGRGTSTAWEEARRVRLWLVLGLSTLRSHTGPVVMHAWGCHGLLLAPWGSSAQGAPPVWFPLDSVLILKSCGSSPAEMNSRHRPRPLQVPPIKLTRWVGHCGQQLSRGWVQR